MKNVKIKKILVIFLWYNSFFRVVLMAVVKAKDEMIYMSIVD